MAKGFGGLFDNPSEPFFYHINSKKGGEKDGKKQGEKGGHIAQKNVQSQRYRSFALHLDERHG